MNDLNDSELERFLKENNAAKLFCEFYLLEKTPDRIYFLLLRTKIGTKRLAKLFNQFNAQLKQRGLISGVFNFVDASQIVSKVNLWNERDKIIEKGINRFDNKTIKKVATDPDARIGCKGKERFWYGYKINIAVCMKLRLITKVAVTPANLSDDRALQHVCLKEGVIFADKRYCSKRASFVMKKNGCVNKAILKNHMKQKDFDRDRYLSKRRMPYEKVFSKYNKKARYIGIAKKSISRIHAGICA